MCDALTERNSVIVSCVCRAAPSGVIMASCLSALSAFAANPASVLLRALLFHSTPPFSLKEVDKRILHTRFMQLIRVNLFDKEVSRSK